MYTQSGRSMVEMLGVLAIIGVLSVGAISGYSKAMDKYKLNKAIDTANHLFATIMTNVAPDNSTLADDGSGSVYYTEMMAKAGWLPDGLTLKETNPRFADDSFNNQVWIYKDSNKAVGVGWTFMRGQKPLCMAFVNLAKEWQNDINLISVDHNADENKTYGALYGNKSCSADVKCLKDVTVAEIDTICNNCENWVCRFYFKFNKF